MRCIFPFRAIFSAWAGKPAAPERQRDQDGALALSPPAQRAATSAADTQLKSIAERKPGALAASFRSIWVSLKYRAALKKAASDCKKFLASLSTLNFELNTATALCAAVKHLGDEEFKALFQNTINKTIDEFSRQLKQSSPFAEAKTEADRNFTDYFSDSGRQTSYGNAYRMAKEFHTILNETATDSGKKAGWVLMEKK